MAWDLAGAVTPRLSKPARNQIYLRIGADDTFTAIEELLNKAVCLGIPLSPGLTAAICQWLAGYVGTLREPRLRTLVNHLQPGEQTRADATEYTPASEG
ncbi:hypothetical protein BN979_03656 [Mycolicibacterium vulneris]|nr:hypothetical protein BN979_03656 [Mycolicibacterium vulneris]